MAAKPSNNPASDTPPDSVPSNVTNLKPGGSWNFESSGYSPERFYLKSCNKEGHREWLKLRVPPHLHDQARYYASQESPFPYRSMNDLIRDALVHRFAQLAGMNGKLEQQIQFEVMLADIVLCEQLQSERHGREFVQTMCEEIDSLVTDYTKRDQLSVAMEKLEHWLDNLPGNEEAHHVYVASYIKTKMTEVRERIFAQRNAAKSNG